MTVGIEPDFLPNSWLTSNSHLYFADRLLHTKSPLNAYGIFDLAKLSEAILLAEKILILPGRKIQKFLKKFK